MVPGITNALYPEDQRSIQMEAKDQRTIQMETEDHRPIQMNPETPNDDERPQCREIQPHSHSDTQALGPGH